MPMEPVLIVGAGPTGLVLALWLTKSGIPVRIIDKSSGPGTTSRALVFHARNLEFYHQMGIDRAALERGVEFKSVHLWRQGVEVARAPFGEFGKGLSPFPYALVLPQDAHEEMLVEELERLGVRVERETELLNLGQDGDFVTAEIRNANGGRETFRTPYLAGCDGARSTTREKLEIGFPGSTYAHTFFVADVTGSGPVVGNGMNGVFDDADFLIVFPIKGEGRVRLVGVVRQDAGDGKNLKWEDVSPGIIQNVRLKVKEVNWFSTYRVHHRVAAAFRKRRVFLLGDAAHIHSPVGGQGMNTGIGDAINLAWKLGAVLKGDSPDALLDTFEPERIPFAQRLVATTDRAFVFVTARGPLAAWVRLHLVPILLPFLLRFTLVRRLMFRTVSQINIKYPGSALSHGPAGTRRGGDRLPWVKFDGGKEFCLSHFARMAGALLWNCERCPASVLRKAGNQSPTVSMEFRRAEGGAEGERGLCRAA